MKFLLLMICAVTALARPLIGQSVEYSRVLFPVWLEHPVSGAHGSLWTTELAIFNGGDREYVVSLWTACDIGLCPPARIEPGRTIVATDLVIGGGAGSPPAYLQAVEDDGSRDINFNLRVRDLSRAGMTWGTELPVVREAESFTTAIHLLDVPLAERFRSMLRVYDFDPGRDRAVLIRFFRTSSSFRYAEEYPPDELLTEHVLHFRTTPADAERPHPAIPGYAELLLDPVPELAGVDRMRVEIRPLTPGLRFWGMVSVTNNETQHVTIISPDTQ